MSAAKHLSLGLIDGVHTYTVLNLATFLMDQTTDQVEFVFQAEEAATITRLGFRYGVRTGTPPTFKISLQGVDLATGNPDGTIKGGGSPASATFTPPADTSWNATWQWITLDNAFTVARGDFLAIVIAYSSGTIDASNDSTFTVTSNNLGTSKFPYAIQNNAGTRTKQSNPPIFGYASAGTAYGTPIQDTFSSGAYNSGTGGADEYALRFKLDQGWGTTWQLLQAKFVGTSVAGSTYKVILYGSATADPTNLTSTNVLQDVTLDTDLQGTTAPRPYTATFDEVTLSTLFDGNVYRVGIQPQAAQNFTLNGLTGKTATEMDVFNGGSEFYLSSRVDAGAWTDVTTSRPFIELILADQSGNRIVVNPSLEGL